MGDTNLDSLVLSGTLTAAGIVGPTTGVITATTISASGQITGAAGTVALPEYSFTADPDCGIYRIGANNLGIAVNAAKVLDIATTGLAVTGALSATTTITATTSLDGPLGATTPAAAIATTLTTSGNVRLNSAAVALGSVATGITAHAGGGQGSAFALTAAINRVDTVGTAADSVKLPAPTFVGQRVTVINNAASNSMQVFGAGTDTINGVTTATGVAQAAGISADYVAVTTGTAAAWFRILSA